jgi:hypothetical protein
MRKEVIGNATVNILGIPYAVSRATYLDRNSYRAGEINYEKQTIKLLDTLGDEHAAITLYHEIVHGILMSLSFLEEHDNEKLVQGLALGLYHALGACPVISGALRQAPPSSGAK